MHEEKYTGSLKVIIDLEGKSRVKKMGRVAGWGCYCKEGGTAEKVTL